MTFGRWLTAQRDREDWIGELARDARGDCRFPWSAEPLDIFEHVRRHLGSDAESLHALQAALDEWNGGFYSLLAAQQERDRGKRDADAERRRVEEEAAASAERARRNARRKELRDLRKG